MVNKVKIVNKLYDIRILIENYRKGNKYFCLFHNDINPSCKIYGNALYCFSCRRFYYVSNIANKLGISIDELYEKIKDKVDLSKINSDKWNKKNELGDGKVNGGLIERYKKYLEMEKMDE